VIILNIEAQHATEDARYIEKLDALGIPVVYVDFRNNPMQNTEPTMRLFGQLFGKEQRAEAFIDFRNRQIHRVTDVIEKNHPPRPSVFIERIGGYTDDCCLSFGNENFGLFVEMAGGNNIARRIIPTTFGQLNPEQVIVANPAHVVITTANWEAFAPGGHWVGVGGADMTLARKNSPGTHSVRPTPASRLRTTRRFTPSGISSTTAPISSWPSSNWRNGSIPNCLPISIRRRHFANCMNASCPCPMSPATLSACRNRRSNHEFVD
jgi:hypothetical protein